MGRSLTAEKHHENSLKTLLVNDSKINAAILVGHPISETRDHLVAIVPVVGDDSGDAAIVDFAEKVAETLPGGIYVLGLAFKLTNTDELKSSQVRLKQLLLDVWKRSKCVSSSVWADHCGCGHQLLLYFNRNTKKFRFHWVQVSNTQASLQPGSDVKFISDPVPLLCIQSNINLPSNIMISSDHSPSNILQSVSKRLCESLLSSVVLVGNKIPKDLDPIEKLVTKGGGSTTLVLNVQMLNRMHTGEIEEGMKLEATSISSATIQVTVANGIHCRAYLPISSTWKDLVKAIKFDAIKSLTIRKNLLLDELADVETTSIVSDQQMLLARRVCINDPRVRFALNDYAMMEETDNDIRERMESIWGVSKYSFVYTEETAKEKQEKEVYSIEEDKPSSTNTPVSGGISQYQYTLAAAVVLAVGIIMAIALNLFY